MAYGEQKTLSQWERRRNHEMVDQHGREWETTLDFIANGPCGPINPKFDAPLRVHTKYLRFQPNKASLLIIDYDQWITDVEIAWKDWDQRLYDDAILLFGTAGPKMYKERAPELLRHTGPHPEHVELIKAAKAGNKWVLGLKKPNGEAYPMPEWAAQFIPKKEEIAEEFPDVDEYGDVEEQYDPKALPKSENPRKNNTKAKEAA